MNLRTTGILAAVALALGAFVYFYEIQGEDARKDAEEAGKRLFQGITASEIDRIALTTEDGRAAVVERRDADGDDAGWRLVEPVEAPGDQMALDGMASTLADLTSDGTIAEPQALPVYGLDDESRIVRFRAGGTDYALRRGNKTPVGANSYVAADGTDAVAMVPTFRLNSFQKGLDDLREGRVLRFDRNTIDGIALSWAGGGAVRLGRVDEAWQVQEPVEGPADADTVDTLLSDLSFLRAEGFVDEPTADDEAGMAAAEFTAVLTPREGEPIAFALGPVVDGTHRLARGTQTALARVPAERLGDFPRKVVAYRFKQLATFVPSEAGAFELAFRDGDASLTIEGVKKDGAWETTPERLAAGMEIELLSRLGRLEGDDIVADRMDETALAGLGLSPPRARLRVFGVAEEGEGEGPLLADVGLGEVDPDAGIAARAMGADAVYRIDPALAEHLPVSLEAFSNRFASQEEPEPEEFTVDPALEAEAPLAP